MKYWLKGCPRCRAGDLREESDIYGAYIECMQCGYVLTAEQEAAVLATAPVTVGKDRVAA